jgi:CHAD domain-containing protein
LLEITVANEAGVRADLDTEFLHDYRVSLRRTRSLLAQIKDVFPADAVNYFRTEFRWLAQSTGAKRDLDVLLLSLRRMSESLPADDLSALLDFLNGKQLHEQRLLEQVLDSDRYQTLLAGWRDFLQDPPPEIPEPKNAARPLMDVASRRVWRLYRRLVDQAMALDAETPPDAIHQVRIQGKKLRYMIDALRSLRDRSELDRIVSSLKKVQSVLGDFNDAQIQERSLLSFGTAFAEAGAENPAALLTLGRLAEKARNRALSLRAEVDHELSRFCKDRSIRADFCRLFKRTTS